MIDVNIVYDVDSKADIKDNSFNKICEKIFHDKNHEEANITLILSGDEKLRELKNTFFQKDVFTDVITFNLEEAGDPIEGEIYISLNQVSENAKEYNQDIGKELKRVIIHGILHLSGYDDQTQEEKHTMTCLEDHYLGQSIVSDQINL